MEVYEVRSSLSKNNRTGEYEYKEIVKVHSDMEEKPKSFSKSGVRILKSDLYKVIVDFYTKVYVVDKEDIKHARFLLKDNHKTIQYDRKKMAEDKLSAMYNHGLDSEIKYSENGFLS